MKDCVIIYEKEIGDLCLNILKKRGIKPRLLTKVITKDTITKIHEIKPDIIFCIGLLQIVPEELLKYGCINIHPSLLPSFTGRYSIPFALMEGSWVTGATLHWMNKEVDKGDIILQKHFQIEEGDTSKEVWEKFNEVGAGLFDRLIDLWKVDRIDSEPQGEARTYCPKKLPELDWGWSGEKIKNYIRAMSNFPEYYAEFKLGDRDMVIVEKSMLKGK